MPNCLLLNCTLKRSPAPSSTSKLLDDLAAEYGRLGAKVETLRVADLDILPGVSSDEGPGDEWPRVRERILAADILVLGTPIWLGQPSSMVKRVLERMDAFLGEADEQGLMPSHGKVAGVAVVGNEDGAHHVCAELFQALNDVGFTLPGSASTYWVGEAMGRVDYQDLPRVPTKTAETTRTLAIATVHLAHALRGAPYPALK